jgi:hypothetical protein
MDKVPEKIPYIICGLDYRRTSTGIHILHFLCKKLNEEGYDAYVNSNITMKGVKTISGKRELLKRLILQGAIVVYPESITRNYLWSKNPVGWKLLPGSFEFEREGLFFAYDKIFGDDPIFRLVDIEPIFTPGNKIRKYESVYLEKGFIPNIVKKIKNSKFITKDWPKKRKNLVKLLQESKVLHIFKNTALTAEARLCGCPVLFHENDENTLENMSGSFDIGLGMTNNPEGLEQAKKECVEFQDVWKRETENNKPELMKFIKITQEWARNRLA